MKKKTLAMFLALALVLGSIIGGTVAWLTAQTEPIVNTFTDSDIDITLEESTGDNYQMVPGCTISKDPMVTVIEGSEKCYLFVRLEKSENFDDFMTYEIADGWTALESDPNVYYRVVDAADMSTAYSVLKGAQVTVKDTVTKEDMNSLTEETYPKLTVTAYASQFSKSSTENFDVNEAWANISGVSGN